MRSDSSMEDYLNSSFGFPTGTGRDQNLNGLKKGQGMLPIGMAGGELDGVGGGPRPSPSMPKPVGLGAIQPQKSASSQTPAVAGQTGPNPYKPQGTAMPGGILSPQTGMSPAGPVMNPATPANPIPTPPPIQRPIQRPSLGMGAVERGSGMGGLGGIPPMNTPSNQ